MNAIWAYKAEDVFGEHLPVELSEIPEKNFLPYLASKYGYTIEQLNVLMDNMPITEADLKREKRLKNEIFSASNKEHNNRIRKMYGVPEKK